MGLVHAGIVGRAGLTQAGYRPGVELDSAAGIDYKGFSLGRMRISPVAQAIFSDRGRTVAQTPITTTPATSASCFRRELSFTFTP